MAACSDEPVEDINGQPPAEAEVGDDELDTVTDSARACELDWTIDNTISCYVPPTLSTPPLIYSSHQDGAKKPACDPYGDFPQPVPKADWTSHHVLGLTAGSGKLCLTVKHGDAKSIKDTDCVLRTECTEVEYTTPGERLDLPPLKAWSVTDADCARAYYDDGGYIELSIESDDLGCSKSGELVRRFPLCPPRCTDYPDDAGCDTCTDRMAVTSPF